MGNVECEPCVEKINLNPGVSCRANSDSVAVLHWHHVLRTNPFLSTRTTGSDKCVKNYKHAVVASHVMDRVQSARTRGT